MKFWIYAIFTLLGGMALFGGLIASVLTDKTEYFLWGWPLALVFLLVATWAKP